MADEVFEVVALSAVEGRAIVRHGDGLFSVQSPYRAGDRYPVTERTLADAIAQLDFTPLSKTFEHLRDVCAFVEASAVEHWQATDLDNEQIVRDTLQHAELWLVDEYLDALAERLEVTPRAVALEALTEVLSFDAAADRSIREKVDRHDHGACESGGDVVVIG